ncbi:MAG: cation-transporting P-type ATPase [Dehalococcoidia bacterium]
MRVCFRVSDRLYLRREVPAIVRDVPTTAAPSVQNTNDLVGAAADGVYGVLGTSPAGLSSEEARNRLLQHGPNELPRPRPANPARLLFEQVSHTLALLLWAGAGLAFLAGLPQLGWAILAIVVINAAFSFWQEYRASRLIETLNRRLPAVVRVRRDGVEHRVHTDDLVPGDLLIVRRGDRVPADARLVRAVDLRLDYSSLTGESEPVEREAPSAPPAPLADAPNCVLAGTTVVDGSGEAVVFATGKSTAFGQVAGLTERVYLEPSPLQRELARTARAIAAVAVITGLFFFLAGDATGRLTARESFIFGVGILVAIVPEGLLPTVTLALALTVQRMGHHNAIVKRLSSAEALGCTTVICTDKTGTITMNEMTARQVWAGEAHYGISGQGYGLGGKLREADDSGRDEVASLELLLRCAVLCNNGIPPRSDTRVAELGDPLDEALLVLAIKGGLDPDAIRRQWRRLREYPFHAERRSMATLHERDGELKVFAKGGPLEILERCTGELRAGTPRVLDDARRIELQRRVEDMSDRGLRVLGFAYRDARDENDVKDIDRVERDLVFLGLVGLDNPLRSEVPEAVERCHSAGIQVVMLTGDYAHTALAVAREARIASSADDAVTGAELDALSDDALGKLLADRQPTVFARVTPEHKLRLVEAYQRLGHIVAVTGDGVNDAPALKAAEVGIAMGRTGTDVAREAADMVLMDDNFATIVRAVEEGRTVFANIKKFLTYVLTSNVAEAAPFVLFVLVGVPLPLTILQVLLVDVGTDMFPAIALGIDPPDPGVMQRPPRARNERIVSAGLLLRALGFLGMLAAALSLAAYFYVQWDMTGHVFHGLADEGAQYRAATTVTMAAIVACQVANAFACRSEHGSALGREMLANRALLIGIAAEILLLTALIGLPPLRHIFDLEPIDRTYWPVLASFPIVFLAVEEVRKSIVRAMSRSAGAKA